MQYCGWDLGKKSSHFCIKNEERKIVREGKVRNRLTALQKAFGKRAKTKIVIEASTKSFWIADRLEEMGHDVIVVDPGKTKAIGSSLIKHDKLDARVLATLCVADVLAVVQRPTQAQRIARTPVVARDGAVRSRTQLMNQVRSLLDNEGLELKSGSASSFGARVRVLFETLREQEDTRRHMEPAIEPVLKAIDVLSEQIAAFDDTVAQAADADPVAHLLMTTPGVGPIVSFCFIQAIRDPNRFKSGRQVGAYLGLVPSLYASGKTHRRGRITKQGNRQARWALTIAANALLSVSRKPSALKAWGLRLAEKVGRKKAKVAVARKLASMLWSMWKHNKAFEPRLEAAK